MARLSAVAVAVAVALCATAPALASDIVAAPDGALWFVDAPANAIGRITTRWQRSEYPLPAAHSFSAAITKGPDGALWFIQRGTGRIGRITTSGELSEFSAGITPGAALDAITAGPDGAVWFTEDSGDNPTAAPAKVARITPAGMVSEFTVRAAPSSLSAIAAGPDGALWFFDLGAGKIGRITTAGAITEYPTPRDFSDATAITAGPGDTLWYADLASIGRISRMGGVNDYRLPLGTYPQDLTTGPDGSMWFTTTGDQIGRLTARGNVKLYTVYSPLGITAGPDRALWFTVAEDNGTTGIGRITTSGRWTEFPPAPKCVVPDLLWKSRLEAAQLMSSKCAFGPRRYPRGKHRDGWVILRQQPRPGRIVPFGTPITVTFGPRPPAPRGCKAPLGATIDLRTPKALVFHIDLGPDPGATSISWRACLRPMDRPVQVFLGDDNFTEGDYAARFQTAGAFIVYATTSWSHYGSSDTTLHVDRLRPHRAAFSETVETHLAFGDDPPNTPVLGTFALSDHGFVAWRSVAGPTTTLYVHDSHGTRTLDTGTIGALRFSGATLSWNNGTVAHSATLS